MEQRRVKRHKLLPIVIILISITFGIVTFLKLSEQNASSPTKVSTVSLSQLEKVLEIAEFSSLENIYNAVATQYDESGNPVYHVAYEGKITAGIDFSSIRIAYSEETKQITITLPNPQILDTTVNMGTMEYIFLDSKNRTESVSIDAYQLCVNDLSARASVEYKLLSMAKDSATDTIKALFEPWLHQLDGDFALVVQ